MTRILLLTLALAGCSSAASVEPTTPHETSPTSETAAAETTTTSDAPAPAEPEAAPRREGYLCAHDRCPAVPPYCPDGQIPSVHGEGGCYGDCVPIVECACDADDDCPAHRGATCGPARFCVVE